MIVGASPSPFVARRATARVETQVASGLAPRRLRIARVVRETADAVTLVLEDPTGAAIVFVPGQFFTLLATVDGEALRRAYSASSSALDATQVTLTAKRVVGGKVSSWLATDACEGMTIDVLGPSGAFTVAPDADAVRHLVLVGGGSGITPLMSIARTILAAEPRSFVSLVYGNRGADDVIFRDALDALALEHADRFTLRHVLSDPPREWIGGVGVLEPDVLAREIALVDLHLDLPTDFFVCGPEPMMRAARDVLAARGVDPKRVHEERFSSPQLRTSATRDLGTHPVTLRTGGDERRFVVASGQTILEAGLAAGAPMPFSCAMGGCGACKVKLASGDVEMDEPSCLSDDERAAGFVLACCARPQGPAVVELP